MANLNEYTVHRNDAQRRSVNIIDQMLSTSAERQPE